MSEQNYNSERLAHLSKALADKLSISKAKRSKPVWSSSGKLQPWNPAERIAALEAQLAAERARVAELEAALQRTEDARVFFEKACNDYIDKAAELGADRERLVYEELTRLANWVRCGDNINRDDARDDIARGIENRLREIDAAREAAKH